MAAFALWNWCVADRIDAAHVRAAIAAACGQRVVALGSVRGTGPGAGVLCDVWHGDGDFPTFVDCFLAPAALSEPTVATRLASRLGAACLLPDDTLNPTRHLLAGVDGTLRPAHVDLAETESGAGRTNLRFCTTADPWCRQWPGGARSRWAPGSIATAA